MEQRPRQEQKKILPNERIIQSIRSGDLERLFTALQDVDESLTGRSHPTAGSEASIRSLRQDLAQFLEGSQRGLASLVIYLGDGGVSRLALRVDGDEVSVFVTNTSTDKVKAKWEELTSPEKSQGSA